jgi:hypothetical protein
MTKKRFDEAAAEYRSEQGEQPFGTYDDSIFAALDAGKVESGKLPIMQIWADVTQPRNIIPREIRGDWDGNPDALGDLLPRWIRSLEQKYTLPVEAMLRGKEKKTTRDLYEVQDADLQKFLRVVNLAAQIRDVGLKQPIGVIQTNAHDYRIIYGERRWTAFHLLMLVLDDAKWLKIPAQVAKVSEWELAKIQAAENFHQAELNAISKARQFAKLLILARKDVQDPPYDPWGALVVPGGCNRGWFAQVADGNLHPIPYGMAPEFERTLTISTTQMRQYRALLRMTGDHEIDNRLWDLGDQYDWSENFMRDIRKLDVHEIRQILNADGDVESALREAVSGHFASKMRNDRYASAPENDARTVPIGTHLDESIPSPSPSPLRGEGNKEGAIPSAARANYGKASSPLDPLGNENDEPVYVRPQINPFPAKVSNDDLKERFPMKAKVETFDGISKRWIGEVCGYLENRVHVVDGFGKKWSFAPERLTLVQGQPAFPSASATPSSVADGKLIEDKRMQTMLQQIRQMGLLMDHERAVMWMSVIGQMSIDQIQRVAQGQSREAVEAGLQEKYESVANLFEAMLHEIEGCLKRWAEIDQAVRDEQR